MNKRIRSNLPSADDPKRHARFQEEREERFAMIDRMLAAFTDVPSEEIEREAEWSAADARERRRMHSNRSLCIVGQPMAMFQRYVSVDWSGRAREHTPVPLAIAMSSRGESAEIVQPPRSPRVRNWTRAECRDWLRPILSPDQPRTIVAFDFGLGLPWGADQGVFDRVGWPAMLQALAELYARYGTARAVAEVVNAGPRFANHGPYRFNEGRADFRFYLQHGVAYYRLIETAIPQAMSQWYLGSGGTVGFHTITGLAALHDLISQREAGHIRFRIWPHECAYPTDIGDAHVLVESYPAIYPKPAICDQCATGDQRDAWRALHWMSEADERGSLVEAFSPAPLRFGRVAGTTFWEQVRFEGWILGVK